MLGEFIKSDISTRQCFWSHTHTHTSRLAPIDYVKGLRKYISNVISPRFLQAFVLTRHLISLAEKNSLGFQNPLNSLKYSNHYSPHYVFYFYFVFTWVPVSNRQTPESEAYLVSPWWTLSLYVESEDYTRNASEPKFNRASRKFKEAGTRRLGEDGVGPYGIALVSPTRPRWFESLEIKSWGKKQTNQQQLKTPMFLYVYACRLLLRISDLL